MKTFQAQYRECRDANLTGRADGPEMEIAPAFPNKKIMDYVEEHGKFPTLRPSLCGKFGEGICSSGHEQCRKMRGADEIQFDSAC